MEAQPEIMVDEADRQILSAYRWRVACFNRTKRGQYRYAYANVVRDGRRGKLLLHRVLTDAPPGAVVDHINGNTLDNRRGNLRVCSHAENMRNRARHINNTSGIKGVSWSRSNNGWVARLAKKHLGTFATRDQAAAAYNAAANAIFGAFARLNPPQ